MNYIISLFYLFWVSQVSGPGDATEPDLGPIKDPSKGLFAGLVADDPAPHHRSERSLYKRSKSQRSRFRPEEGNGNDRNVRKRETFDPVEVEGNMFTPAYCTKLGFQCGNLDSMDGLACLINCANSGSPLNKKYSNFIPNMIQYLCSTINTMITTIPSKLAGQKDRRYTVPEFVALFNIKMDDIPEFATTVANALLAAYLRRAVSKDTSLLKVLLKNLEVHDSGDQKQRILTGDSVTLTSEFGSGKFINQNCEVANIRGDAITLSETLKKRMCLLDILMPGYLFFSRAPAVIKNVKIQPILKGFLLPSIMLTGVQCCLIPYTVNGTAYKCPQMFSFLNTTSEPQKVMPSQKTVCGSIPSYQPSIISPNKPIRPMSEEAAGGDPCNPVVDDLYTNEDEEPCISPTIAAAGNATVDYSDAEAVNATAMEEAAQAAEGKEGGELTGRKGGFDLDDEAEIEAIYGENGPKDEEFVVE